MRSRWFWARGNGFCAGPRDARGSSSFDDEVPQVLDVFADRTSETFLGKNWWTQFTHDNAATCDRLIL